MDAYSEYREINIVHFNKKIKQYKRGAKAVSYGSEGSQKIRFEVLSEIGNLNGKTILDVGCGLGDFYGFLKNKGIEPKKYVGIDINPLMISKAKKNYPDAKFFVGDLLKIIPEGRFDYVFQSGIFNLVFQKWQKITYKILTQMYNLSKIGVGSNFLSTLTPFKKDKNSYYADPNKIINFIYTHLSKNFVLRHNYKPNDFTVYIYKK